jgi:biotin-[acetyl-CoA-carboxylase] ligase BirA-like protein
VTIPAYWQILEETPSTQDVAREWGRRELGTQTSPALLWVRAARQVQGRGRQGRTWIAHEGDLTVSCALRWPTGLLNKSLLPLLAGMALFETLGELEARPSTLFLKWPNDLFADLGATPRPLRKLGGVLAESFGATLAVVGWGVNLQDDRLSEADPANPRYAPASLSEVLGHPAPQAAQVAERLAVCFGQELHAWSAHPFVYEPQLLARLQTGPMQTLWGREGQVSASGVRARALGLGEGGVLRVQLIEGESQGEERQLASGEFTFF